MSIDELIGGTVVDKSEKKTVQNLINYTKIKAIENKERIIKISYLFRTCKLFCVKSVSNDRI